MTDDLNDLEGLTAIDDDLLAKSPIHNATDIDSVPVPTTTTIAAGTALRTAIENINTAYNDLTVLHTVGKGIIKNKVMSRSSAQIVENYFKGFMTDHITLETFSVEPSKVNASYTVGFIAGYLDEATDSFIQLTKEVLTTLIANMTEDISSIMGMSLDQINDIATNMESKHYDVLEALLHGKNTIVYSNAGFVNVGTAKLEALSNMSISWRNTASFDLRKLIASLLNDLSTSSLAGILDIITNHRDIKDFCKDDSCITLAKSKVVDLDLRTLAEFYRDSGLGGVISSMHNIVNQGLTYLVNELNRIEAISKDGGVTGAVEINNFNIGLTPELLAASFVLDVVPKLSTFNQTADNVFTLLKSEIV